MIETFVPFGVKHGISESPDLGRPSGALSSVVFDMPKEKKYTSVILIVIILFTISSIFQTI